MADAGGSGANEVPGNAVLAADDDYIDDLNSDTTSLMSSILKYRHENGRTYHGYKDGSYVLPNDTKETERLDLQHNLLVLTFGGKLHLSKFDKPPRRVLDVGCGSGIWSIDFADENLESEVTGIDLSPSQPSFVPPNVTFVVEDLEDDWVYEERFDFIFSRFMTGSILDFPRFFRQSFEFLNPGGTIEVQDIVYPTECDDGTLKPDAPLRKWSVLLAEQFASIGRPINSALKYKEQLAAAGFVDIVKVQAKWPSNGWPRDPHHKQIGVWAGENSAAALEALSLALFTRPAESGGLGWTKEEVRVLLADVRKDLKNPRIHGYWPMLAYHAKKPAE